jgi:flagellar basal body-associated protein FliL
MLEWLKSLGTEKTPVVVEAPETDEKKILKLVLIISCSVLLAAGIAFLVYRLIKKYGEQDYGDYEDTDEDEDFFEGENA